MVSEVIITDRALEMFDEDLYYLVYSKKNSQAASHLIDEFNDTQDMLYQVAESLGFCRDEDLKALGYRIIFFNHMEYLFIYRVTDNKAVIDAMYHQSQDYENLFKTEEVRLL